MGDGGIERVHPIPNIGCNADPIPNQGSPQFNDPEFLVLSCAKGVKIG